jgi:hypothetical protein
VELENLALRHQIGVFQRSAAKRLKLTSCDRRLRWAVAKPETVLAGHRAGFRRFWTWKVGAASLDDPSFRARSEI